MTGLEQYEGFIGFLKGRLERGNKLTLVRDWRGKLYAREEGPSGMEFKWHYPDTVDAEAIAEELGIEFHDGLNP